MQQILTVREIIDKIKENPQIQASELGISNQTLEEVKKSDAYKFLLRENGGNKEK